MILHYFIDPNQSSYIVNHPSLVTMSQKLSYSETEKLESPDLKVEYLFHPNSYDIYSTYL